MSITRISSVFCDGPDGDGLCPHSCWIAQTKDAASARREARAAGWVRRNGIDLCPECLSTQEESK